MSDYLLALEGYFWSLAVIVAAVIVGLLAHLLLFFLLSKVLWRTALRDSILNHLRAPMRLLLTLLAVQLSLPLEQIELRDTTIDFLHLTLSTALILTAAWLLVRATSVFRDWALLQYDISASDNLKARTVVTQVDIVRKILIVIVAVFSGAAALMNFDNFRQVGAGLLASAGVAGLVIGFAAQRTLANILAGFQIALTQPIRIDDVVIVEGEWGRIEEITLTYVVVAIWDLRRLVLPISYFIEQPFENWTRKSASILGTVFLYVDYTAPIEEIRQYLAQTLEESDYWDGAVCRLHVTESGARTVELRALMSSANSGDAWELRCEVREKLVTFIQQHHFDALPKLRTDLSADRLDNF